MSKKISLFSDTFLSEIKRLSAHAQGFYIRLLFLAHSENGELSACEKDVARNLNIHTNAWRKIKAELLEKKMISERGGFLLPAHFTNSSLNGVCGGITPIDTQGDTPPDTPPDTIGVSTPDTPPVVSLKPAENRKKNNSFNSISNSNYNSKDEIEEDKSSSSHPVGLVRGVSPDEVWKIQAIIQEKFPMILGGIGAAAEGWLREGASCDLDVIPALEKLAAKPPPSGVRSLNYITKCVSGATAERLAIGKTFAEDKQKMEVNHANTNNYATNKRRSTMDVEQQLCDELNELLSAADAKREPITVGEENIPEVLRLAVSETCEGV